MYEKRKISYFNCFIPTATQHYSSEYELKYHLVCTRNKKEKYRHFNQDDILETWKCVIFFFFVVWTCDF